MACASNKPGDLLSHTVDRVCERDPRAGVKLREFIERAGPAWQLRGERFLSSFQRFLETRGKPFDYGIDCYLKLCASVATERLNFLRSQCYSNTSFTQVAECVYHNPDVMQYHMYGLVFAQFLWPDQYHRYSFFCDAFPGYAPRIKTYLEIGGGHALYVTEAASILSADAQVDVVDISASSLELARGMMPDAAVTWHQADIFDFAPQRRYDFITIGEVLEHLEDPRAMLRRILELLTPDGRAFITTPANAPMIDHIYLFNNAQEIRDMLQTSGFEIEAEASMFADDMPAARGEKLKAPLMYAAFVRPAA
jgi:2-polyprenyl-3-methyl-5-hydroxy-6-metoxy-1,4-benzoquinol methylase